MKGEQPSPLFAPLSLQSALFLSLSLLPSPPGPRVALPRGLDPNHPELVGGNRRLPAGCLVTADPWDTHTHTHSDTHKLNTDTHPHICLPRHLLLSLGISPATSPPQLDPAKATASPRKLNNSRRLTVREGQISGTSSTANQFKPVSNIVFSVNIQSLLSHFSQTTIFHFQEGSI